MCKCTAGIVEFLTFFSTIYFMYLDRSIYYENDRTKEFIHMLPWSHEFKYTVI